MCLIFKPFMMRSFSFLSRRYASAGPLLVASPVAFIFAGLHPALSPAPACKRRIPQPLLRIPHLPAGDFAEPFQ
jgi:hypothetical protein